MKMPSTTVVTVLFLVFVSGVLSYPNIEIRRSYQEQTKAFRMGYCKFDEAIHIQCYVCARLYSSSELYKDCCSLEPQTEMCRKMR